jgi:uncharacterized membrane protein
VLVIAALALVQSFSPAYALLLVTCMAGIGIAALIVLQELGVNNELTKTFCNQGKDTDCNAVIQSGGSKLFSWLGWSDIGIVFFSSQWLILIIAAYGNSMAVVFPLLKIMTVASLPFTVFSVYYQWKQAKKWCTLCLAVVTLLLIQCFSLLILQPSWQVALQWQSLVMIPMILMAALAVWLLVKPLLKDRRRLQRQYNHQLRFKYNTDVFLPLLEKQRQADTAPFTRELELATSDAPLQILVACSPYCKPCANAHKILHELAEKYESQISIAVRFTIQPAVAADPGTKVVDCILQHTVSFPPHTAALRVRKLLHDWFENMDYENFTRLYPLINTEDTAAMLQEHDAWTKKSGIAFTPTFFINGYQLPKPYNAGDLPLLIRGLVNRAGEPMKDDTPLLKAV